MPFGSGINKLLGVNDKMADAHRLYDLGEYNKARAAYLKAYELAAAAILLGIPEEQTYPAGHIPEIKSVAALIEEMEGALVDIRDRSIRNLRALDQFEAHMTLTIFHNSMEWFPGDWLYPKETVLTDWLRPKSPHVRFALVSLVVYQIPLCLGDCALAMGDYGEAVRQYANFSPLCIGKAVAENIMGYVDSGAPSGDPSPSKGVPVHSKYNRLFSEGGLVYTISRNAGADSEFGHKVFTYPRFRHKIPS